MVSLDSISKKLMDRIQQIAAAEDEMRAQGKIDKEGHLKKKNGKKSKIQDEK
jgi:hypothetical protein